MSTVDKLLKFKEAGIKLKTPDYSNSVEIFVEGDWEDGDCVSNTSFKSVDEFIELYPIFKKILEHKNYNWDKRKKYLREEELEIIENSWDLIPAGYESSIHTIDQIKCYFRCSDGFRYKIEI